MSAELVLAGDVGGTHARLALFSDPAKAPEAVEIASSADADGLDAIIARFLERHPAEPVAASIGVAGPVRDGRTDTVNLAWPVDAGELSRTLDIERVTVINDLEANAWGVPALGPRDVHVMAPGEPVPGGTAALISAGTGLGQAFISYEGDRPTVHSSEGGHVDFAPRTPLQEQLRAALSGEDDHVSYEDVCSGRGLVSIYGFLRARAGHADDEPAEAATITKAALAGENPEAVQALDMMVAIYGAAAGNLALTVRAGGGVYLGGGIPPKILPALESSAGGFLAAFRAKGRLRPMIERVPVAVILNELTALIGAARHAFAAASGERG